MVWPDRRPFQLEAFLVSTGAVAIAEIGDKTQLLALVLAARFRKPVSIILGIFVATVGNHAIAALLGVLIAEWLQSEALSWAIAISFIAMGLWTLKPDKLDDDGLARMHRWGAFMTTAVAFFLVEVGDKTQVATMALAARFQDLVLVTAGTTFGMMLANVPAVVVGDAAATRLPLKAIRFGAALVFIAIGVAVLLDVADVF